MRSAGKCTPASLSGRLKICVVMPRDCLTASQRGLDRLFKMHSLNEGIILALVGGDSLATKYLKYVESFSGPQNIIRLHSIF